MASRRNPPSVRVRRLAAELLRLRKAARLSREAVTEKTGINNVTLYRLETARTRPQRRTLLALLDLYQVAGRKRSELLELSLGAEYPGWLKRYQHELPEAYTAFISFEAEARSAHNYESLLVPGLLQTEDYARAVVKSGPSWVSDEEVERRVQTRMARQAVLTKHDPLTLWAIVDEAAIRRLVGGVEIMQKQARALLDWLTKPHVTMQVVPLGAGAHAGMQGSFIHFDFPDPADSDLVYVEGLTCDLFLDDHADVRIYATAFEHLRALALSPADSVEMIATWAGLGK
jgi:transcriptional regulator with XRE-family HTH domain